MSTLIEKIKQSQKQYRISAIREKNQRAKFKAGALTTLIGELENKSKNGEVSESEVISLVKKYIKDIEFSLARQSDEKLIAEKEALSVFLPRQMTESEIEVAVFRVIDDWRTDPTMADMGKIMGILKKIHGSSFDGAVASKVVRSILR